MTTLSDGTKIVVEPPENDALVVTPGQGSIVIGGLSLEVEVPVEGNLSIQLVPDLVLPDGTVVTVDAPSEEELELLVIRGEKGDQGLPGSAGSAFELQEQEAAFTDVDAPNLPPLYIRRNPVNGKLFIGRVS